MNSSTAGAETGEPVLEWEIPWSEALRGEWLLLGFFAFVLALIVLRLIFGSESLSEKAGILAAVLASGYAYYRIHDTGRDLYALTTTGPRYRNDRTDRFTPWTEVAEIRIEPRALRIVPRGGWWRAWILALPRDPELRDRILAHVRDRPDLVLKGDR